jgi:MFS family permease
MSRPPSDDVRRTLSPLVAIVSCFGAVFVLSQFFRASNAVIAKTLSSEFALSPEALGLLTGVFFFAFAAAQIPVGMLFDRFGARRTVPVVLTAAVVGSLLYGFAENYGVLMAGRALLGIGSSGVLMGALFLFGQWAPPASYSPWMGRMIAIGGAGGLLSTTPLAAIAETVGWRTAFWGAAALTALGGVAIFLLVRDRAPSTASDARPPESARESLRGVREALATPGLPAIIAMGFASYPVVITILGLWGGPYLIDRHGLGSVEAGNVLLVMALALIAANLVLGPLERRFDTRKQIVLGCAAVVIGACVVLAAVPDLGTATAIAMFALIGACGSFNIVLAGHVRSLFTDRLAGRGMALMAIAFMGGPAVLQSLGGAIVGAFPAASGVAPAAAYQALFGFLAAVVALAAVVYARVPDAKPSAGFAAERPASGD